MKKENEMRHYDVVAAVVVHEGRYLCMLRPEGKSACTSLRWEFPGGKIEAGETPEEALKRELMEEMEYDVVVGDHIITVEHQYPDFSITLHAYYCTSGTTEFERKEHVDHKWLSKDELRSLEWCPADVGIVDAVVG